MVNLGLVHYAYIVIICIILFIVLLKKDVVLPCIVSIFIIGFIFTGNIIKAVQILFNAIVVSGREFIEVIVIISMVNAMSKVLKDIGADELMIKPIRKLMINPSSAFFILGITMMITSWVIWPTPAVVFIGAIMVPAAVKAGLPPVWAGVALSLFGNGAALSSDFFIQAAPAITSKTAGIEDPFKITKAIIPFWSVMSITAIAIGYIMMRKDIKGTKNKDLIVVKDVEDNVKATFHTKLISALTLLLFSLDIFFMYMYKLKGEGATALIGGTAVIIIIFALIIKYNIKSALTKFTKYIVSGFTFGIKVFAPIIIIGAFFFLGSKETASKVFQVHTNGFLTDIGIYISNKIPVSKISAIVTQTGISTLLGVGGSGFSGLPAIGTLAQVFNTSIGINKASIAGLGQIITIWIGGGTIIPWSLVPIVATCDIEAFELARKNIIPILVGIIVTVIYAIIFI